MARPRDSFYPFPYVLMVLVAISSVTMIIMGLYLCIEASGYKFTDAARESFIIYGAIMVSFGLVAFFVPLLPKQVCEICCSFTVNNESFVYFTFSIISLLIAVSIIYLPIKCKDSQGQDKSAQDAKSTSSDIKYSKTNSTLCSTIDQCKPDVLNPCDPIRFYACIIAMVNSVLMNFSSTLKECYSTSK